MVVEYVILFLFIILAFLSLTEESISIPAKKGIYVVVGIILILLAGFREIGLDPDSEMYKAYFDDLLFYEHDYVEYSYILISKFVHLFSNNVTWVLLIYALLGVGIKMYAFPKYSTNLLFLTLLTYISYMYELQELIQIRSGILGGCFLIAIYFLTQNKRMLALLFILLGTFFHYSGFILLCILFLSTKPLTTKTKIFWITIVACCYLVGGVLAYHFYDLEESYIGKRLSAYQLGMENQDDSLGTYSLFTPMQCIQLGLFFYLILFADTITEKAPYFPILLKCFAIGLCGYALLINVGVIGERIQYAFHVVIPLLFPMIIYTIRPKSIGIILVILLDFLFLNYILRYTYTINDVMLWPRH